MSYVDLGVLVVLAFFTLMGFLFGFARTAGKLFGWILSFLIVLIITDLVVNVLLEIKSVSQFVLGTQSAEKFSLFNFFYKKIPADLRNISLFDIKTIYSVSGKQGIESIIESKGNSIMSLFSPFIASFIIDPIYFASSLNTVGEMFALQMSLTVFSFIVGALLFLVVRIVMAIVARVVREINCNERAMLSRLGGIGLGFLRGMLYASLLLVFCNFVASIGIKHFDVVKEQINNSVFSAKAINEIEDIIENVKKTNKANDNTKKCIKLIGYNNGTEEEINEWKKIINMVSNTSSS